MPMANEPCIHCGQPSEDGDRVTESGRVHERCWDAFSEENPVAKSSVVAGCFGLSMVAGGAVVLSIGLAAFAMGSSLDSAFSQNPVVGIPIAIMWFIAMSVAFLAIPAGAIMLSIAFFTWVATNNNAFKNYVAGGVAIVALAVFIVGPTLLSWVNSYERSRPINRYEEPNPVKPDGTYTIIDQQQGARSPDSPISGSEEVWVGGTMVGYAEQTYWSNGELQSDNRRDVEKHVITYFYESGIKEAEHRAEPRGADPAGTGWWGYWYENGQQKYALNLVNAKREGQQVYWYENGQQMLTGNYVGGLPDGPLSEWDANGKETRLCSGNGFTLNGDCAALFPSKENGGVETIETDNGTPQARTQTRAALEEYEAIQGIYKKHKSETTCVEYRNMVEQIRVFDGSSNLVPESFRYAILYPSKKAMPTISDLVIDRITRIKRVRSQCFK
jgi:hypothetical protein